jgi:cytoskeletal protein RodZ
MKSLKSLYIALLALLLLVAGSATARAQTTPQTGDPGQSGTNTPKKKPAADAATSKSQGAPTPASAATPPASTTPAGKSAAAPATPESAPASSAPAAKPNTTQQTPPAKSAGMVWVNTDSGVYHKPGTRWYGKTKQGKYMTEADAIKAGYHAAKKE